MNKELQESLGKWEIDIEDWEKTPESVKRALVELLGRLQEQTLSREQLEEKLRTNSENSHNPPSKDPPQVEKKKSKPSKKKRGGQPGHQGKNRLLYETSECTEIKEYYPEKCSCCGAELEGEDEQPYRHQVIEIPEIQLSIIEHRLHRLSCRKCGHQTRAVLPETEENTGYGSRVVAIVGLLSGVYRHSHRMVQTAMEDLFGVRMSLGTISRIHMEVSESVAESVRAAKEYVQQASVVGAPETGFAQGNADGQNPNNRKAWLWVLVTPLVSFFQVSLSRSTEAAQELLGVDFRGILISDRYNAYNWLFTKQRQLCWAHLKREFIKISERSGLSRPLGRDLLAQQKRLFRLWQKVRDGTLSYSEFQVKVKKIRTRLGSILQEASELEIGAREKTPLAKTVRTCRQLLKVEEALWLFTEVPDVEPTNNASERAIRPAVIWRRTSFGSQSEAGSIFLARMLTVVTSLRSQRRNVLSFLTDAVKAARHLADRPSLLPESPTDARLEQLSA